jgi:hypothetical protein
MKSISILLYLLGIATFAYSQDTIQFINKAAQSVKVTEVGIDEIKYHRFDNLDGPLYVASKSEIRYIKYSNGHVDSVTVASKLKTETPETLTVYSAPISTYGNEKIVISGSRLSHNGKAVGESRLYRLISNVPIPEKKAELYKEYLVMKSYKKRQYLFGFVGLGAGLALPYIGLMSSFVFDDGVPFAIGLAAGATVGITGAVLSGINKHKRTKKRIDIANLYNN